MQYHNRHVRCCEPLREDELPHVVNEVAAEIAYESFWLGCRKYYMDVTAAQWEAIRMYVFTRDHHVCVYCGRFADTVDHIIPVSKHGSWHPDNCVAACQSCNSKKGTRDAREFVNDSHGKAVG